MERADRRLGAATALPMAILLAIGFIGPLLVVAALSIMPELVFTLPATPDFSAYAELVAQGYWNAPEKTAERFRPLAHRPYGLTLPEIAVWSGDTVRRDEEGFLYFVGRRDEMIKTSGYRVSPNEIEEVLYEAGLVGEATAFGIAHPTLGQGIVVVATPAGAAQGDAEAAIAHCKRRLPGFMVPAHIEFRAGPLPRNANGKIDRKALTQDFTGFFEEASS